MTVIDKAKELINDIGREKAVIFFEDRISELGKPKNFEDICKLSGWETAVDFIKGNI